MISLLTSMLNSDWKSIGKKLLLWALIPLAAWYISLNWYQLMLIQGNSMKPTYHHLQVVLLDKNSDEYIPGDVIAFYSEGLSCVLVKRIIAGPGDSAQIVDGTLLVNGQISQIYPDIGMISDPGIMAEPAKLGPEQYLVLGDNLSQSIDSRYLEVGIVFEGEIFGKIYTGK